MQTVNVQIDISSPTGRKLMNEIQKHPKAAKIQAEMPESISEGQTYSLNEAFSKVEEKLNDHYGTNTELKY